MSMDIAASVKLMLAILLGTIIVVMILVVFAGAVGNASISTQIISTNTNLTNLLPFIGMMIAGGIFMVAIEGRRH